MANVLIVDDNPDAADISSALLESAGHHVQTKKNGAEGLECLRARPLPDCVLLDVDMPIVSGPEMAHQMRLNDTGEERIPIVLVSANDDLSAVASQMGTPYFLAKATVNYDDALLNLLDRALRERRAPTSA